MFQSFYSANPNYSLYGIPEIEQTYKTPGLEEQQVIDQVIEYSKQGLETYCDNLHEIVMQKRIIRKEKLRYLTRTQNKLEVIDEERSEEISNADTKLPKSIPYDFIHNNSYLDMIRIPEDKIDKSNLATRNPSQMTSTALPLKQTALTALNTQKSHNIFNFGAIRGRQSIEYIKRNQQRKSVQSVNTMSEGGLTATETELTNSFGFTQQTNEDMEPSTIVNFDRTKTISFFFPQERTSLLTQTSMHSGYSYTIEDSEDEQAQELFDQELNQLAYTIDTQLNLKQKPNQN